MVQHHSIPGSSYSSQGPQDRPQDHRQHQQYQGSHHNHQYYQYSHRPQQHHHQHQPLPNTYVPRMSHSDQGNNDENGDGGGISTSGPQRAQTEAPLSEMEMEQLQMQLQGATGGDDPANTQNGGPSTFTRLINQNASQIGVSWLLQSNNFPSTSAANTNGTVEGDGEATSASGAMIVRGDTLERNPGFINPMEMTERPVEEGQQPEPEQQKITEVKVEGAAGAVSQQYIITNEDNTVTVVQHTDMAQWQQLSADDAIAMASGANSSPTGSSPADKAWPGDHGFRMNFMKLSQNAKNKSWDYSADLNKLFIDMGKYVQISFHAGPNPPDGFFIRALPVYASPSHLSDVVKRCPNHASMSDASNSGFYPEFSDHLIRVNHDAAMYEKDALSNRLSVVVPFDRPQVGTDYCSHLFKFMCLGSDVGGINRRPLKVIFTLENGAAGEVVGRQVVDIRICSCPKRDKTQEENKYREDKKKALGCAEGLARSNSVFTRPSAKKRKMEVEEFVMVPVAKADFEKINEFAEAAVIMRNLDKAHQIKDQRKKLLDMHNKKYLNKPKP